MDSIVLNMPVTVKAKLTKKLKTKLLKDLDEDIKRAELEMQQLEIEKKRALQENTVLNPTAADRQRLDSARQHFESALQKRADFCEQAQQRKDEMEKLVFGAEIIQGTVERQVEVHIGDDMRELMNVEVLVEDDKIIAIRG